MWEVDASVIGGWIGSFLWPFFRVGGFFMLAPIIGTMLVPGRIRLIFSIFVTLALVPVLPETPLIDSLSIGAFIIITQQILIGVAMALILQVLLQMFVVAGQLIAMQMGLGFASMMDPANGISVTVLSQFHLMLVTMIFLAMNGHLAMIEVLAASFEVLPVGAGFLSNNAIYSMVGWLSWMFAGSLLMAIPAVTSLLVVNSALGIITRAAPQLNIFAIGFPFMLLLGLCILYVTMGNYLPHFDNFTREALDIMRSILIMP